MIPRNANIGDNSTQLGAEYRDPAALVEANDAGTRITDFLAALRQPWWDQSACRGMSPDLFHDARRQRQALTVCGGCPSMLPCRTEAISDASLDFGVRGGMDVAARKNARRNLKETTE